MCKLLIVDDDPWVLEWFSKHMDWRECGIARVSTAANGFLALQHVEKECPDIIVTDIKMDRMTGLELLEKVRDRYPHIRVILLSGYNEFEYARTAIKKGAVDYLLKPVEERELMSLIKRIAAEIKLEKENRLQESKIVEQLEQSIPLLQENSVKELLAGDVSASRNIKINFSAFHIVIFELDCYSDLKRRLPLDELKSVKSNFKGMVERIMGGMGTAVSFFEGHQLVVVFSPEAADSIQGMDRVSLGILSQTGRTASCGISRLKKLPSQAQEAYMEANEALKSKFYYGRNQVIHSGGMEATGKDFGFVTKKKEQLMNAFSAGDHMKIEGIVKEVISEVYEKKIPYDSLKLVNLRLIGLLTEALEKLGMGQEAVLGQGLDMNADMDELETIHEYQAWILDLFQKGVDLAQGKGSKRSRKIIDDTIAFVRQHMKEEISLDTVAKVLYVNPAYLSRLFKSEVGETFTHFLMKTRVEMAKEYLSGSYLKVYEISEQVGYTNERYFSRIFKDFEGLSPNEYRDRVRGN